MSSVPGFYLIVKVLLPILCTFREVMYKGAGEKFYFLELGICMTVSKMSKFISYNLKKLV